MKKIIFILVVLLTVLTVCSDINVDKTETYKGDTLKIGIIGDIPEIREKQLAFEQIKFDYLKEENFDSKYNAIFITKENFSEVSNTEYASIYKESKVPFYFIDNEKSHVNFIQEDLSYEDEPNWNDGMYIDGVFYIKNKCWGYGLYNDTRSKTNIKAVYSRVFEDISKIKNNKLP